MTPNLESVISGRPHSPDYIYSSPGRGCPSPVRDGVAPVQDWNKYLTLAGNIIHSFLIRIHNTVKQHNPWMKDCAVHWFPCQHWSILRSTEITHRLAIPEKGCAKPRRAVLFESHLGDDLTQPSAGSRAPGLFIKGLCYGNWALIKSINPHVF